jgi:subtilase family serine protease
MADSIRRVAEKNENNNIAQTPIDLKRPPCDLKITSITTIPRRAKIGDRIEIRFKELNEFRGALGAATSLAGAHYIQIKLEYENAERRKVERVMRNIRVSSLKGKEERELTTHITLPTDMGYIRCFIEVITDSRGQVTEHSEDNNSRRLEFMAYYR